MAYKVVLDPGHGLLADKYGVNRWSETKSAMRISRHIQNFLTATGQFEVKLTKNTDLENPALTTRGRTAYSFRADLFLSVHENGFDGTAHGVTTFHSVDIPGDQKWASMISKEVAAVIGTNVRGGDGADIRASQTSHSAHDPSTLEDYYTVIDSAQDIGCPHVMLVEAGFKDNPNDYAGISAPGGEERIAKAIVKVICQMFNVAFDGTPATPPVPVTPPPAKTETPKEMAIRLLGKDTSVSKNDPRKELVKTIQKKINEKIKSQKIQTPAIGEDGLFGTLTYKAVFAYQKANKLTTDGIVGVQTLTSLLS